MKPMMSNSGDKELWKHSMRVAAGCEYLANLTKIMDSDEAFISGFIHDIGKMVLNMTNDKLYAKVKDRVSEGADILEAERKYFDSDHVKTGSLLAKRWQLPILLANIVSYHHAPSLSSIPVPCNLVDVYKRQPFFPTKLLKFAVIVLPLISSTVSVVASRASRYS